MRFNNTPKSRIALAAALAGAKQTIIEAEDAAAEDTEAGTEQAFSLIWEMVFVHLRNLEDWRIPE